MSITYVHKSNGWRYTLDGLSIEEYTNLLKHQSKEWYVMC